MVKDAGLERKVYAFDKMARLFNSVGHLKGVDLESTDLASLGMANFLTLLVHLAFFRENPRYTAQLEGAPKLTQETVPLLQCVKNMLQESMPRMRTGDSAIFRKMLRGDAEAQRTLEEYKEKISAWLFKLQQQAESAGTDVYTEFLAALDKSGSLGVRSLDLTDAVGIASTYKSSLTALQARHALLNAQDPLDIALGKLQYEPSHILEALARAGDKKYATIMQMTNVARIRGMFANVLDESTELQIIEEAMGKKVAGQDDAAYDEFLKEQTKKNWLACWTSLTFKDMYGYPLWETQLHDVLQEAFPELQSIFLYYCGSSIAGTDTVDSATKLGLMEVLQLAKDCDICNSNLPVDQLSRHFCSSNALAAIANSGSADRHKMPGSPPASARNTQRTSRGAKTNRTGGKSTSRGGKTSRAKTARAATVTDDQLNLYEFLNFVVRIAFWRCNPQWGSKYNTHDLTPVPEATTILLEVCILPNARRDTSGDFRRVLKADQATQAVLLENSERLRAWLVPILRKERRIDNPNPQMTYRMWSELMDGPEPDATGGIRKAKPACPKMVGEWSLAQESQITSDERTAKSVQVTFMGKLSLAQCRWNFLRSQSVEQLEVGEVDAEQVLAAHPRPRPRPPQT